MLLAKSQGKIQMQDAFDCVMCLSVELEEKEQVHGLTVKRHGQAVSISHHQTRITGLAQL
jgi:hypothetical protein